MIHRNKLIQTRDFKGVASSLTQHLLITCAATQDLLKGRYATLVEAFTTHALLSKEREHKLQALNAVSHMLSLHRTASSTNLTAFHDDFLKLCLATKYYHLAAPVVRADIITMDAEAQGLTVQKVLQYFYYSGIVLISQRAFKAAMESLLVAITAPAEVASAISVEAYKHYLLVSILVHGKVQDVPKSLVPHLKAFRDASVAYTDFAAAFASLEAGAIDAVVARHAAVFAADRTTGLVKQCAARLIPLKIKRLTEAYLTLSLDEIAARVGMTSRSALVSILAQMIHDKEVHASIDMVAGTVSFDSDIEQFESTHSTQVLQERIATAISVNTCIKRKDDELRMHQTYIKKKIESERSSDRYE